VTDVIHEIVKTAVRLLKEDEKRPAPDGKAINALEKQIENLVEAMASGALKHSPALAERLGEAERELDRRRATQSRNQSSSKVLKHLPRLADECRALVTDLEGALSTSENLSRARAEIRKLVGEIRITPKEGEIWFEYEEGRPEAALLSAAGLRQQLNMVAGVGFEPTTFGL
jgi:hypothetical protein